MTPTSDSPGLVAAAAEIRVAVGSVEVVVTVAAATVSSAVFISLLKGVSCARLRRRRRRRHNTPHQKSVAAAALFTSCHHRYAQ